MLQTESTVKERICFSCLLLLYYYCDTSSWYAMFLLPPISIWRLICLSVSEMLVCTHFPALEDFCLVVCHVCSKVVTPQGILTHYGKAKTLKAELIHFVLFSYLLC